MLLHPAKLLSRHCQQKRNHEKSNRSNHLNRKVEKIALLVEHVRISPEPLNYSRNSNHGDTRPLDISKPSNRSCKKYFALRAGQQVQRGPEYHSRIKQSAQRGAGCSNVQDPAKKEESYHQYCEPFTLLQGYRQTPYPPIALLAKRSSGRSKPRRPRRGPKVKTTVPSQTSGTEVRLMYPGPRLPEHTK